MGDEDAHKDIIRLEALGVDINHGALRLSFVHYTRQQDVNAVIEALDEVL